MEGFRQIFINKLSSWRILMTNDYVWNSCGHNMNMMFRECIDMVLL